MTDLDYDDLLGRVQWIKDHQPRKVIYRVPYEVLDELAAAVRALQDRVAVKPLEGMTGLDDLLAEVAIRTDRSHHWTGKHNLTISDAELAKELAGAVRTLRDRMDNEIAQAREDGWNQRAMGDAVRALRDRPCPHVVTDEEGTSHCALAESANTAWAARWQEQFDRAEWAETMLACPHGIPGRDCNCAPDRPGGTDGEQRARQMIEDVIAEQAPDSMTGGFRPGGTDNPTVSCWETGPDEHSTCMLPDNHDGPHEFTPDSEITVQFSGDDDGR